jgi:hypothetical protein
MRQEPPATFTYRPPTVGAGDRRRYDPLPLCIYTTIGVISWIITPPLTVAIFGALGVAGYVRARRRGLARSRCKLGDTRLVIAYLAAVAAAGAAVSVYRLISLFS